MLDSEIPQREPPYAQIVLVVAERAPLFAQPRLARIALAGVCESDRSVPGRLWGVLVLPESVRLVVGPLSNDNLIPYVRTIKWSLMERLLPVILRADDNSLDLVMRGSPIYGGAIWRIWKPGYHRIIFHGTENLSRTLEGLRQRPVRLGLARDPSGWEYRWFSGIDNVNP